MRQKDSGNKFALNDNRGNKLVETKLRAQSPRLAHDAACGNKCRQSENKFSFISTTQTSVNKRDRILCGDNGNKLHNTMRVCAREGALQSS